jgi:hypothetical protein
LTALANSTTRHIGLPFSFKRLGMLLQLPAVLVVATFFVIYASLWGTTSMLAPFNQPALGGMLLLLSFPIGIVIHEWLHGLGYQLGGAPRGSISIGVVRLTAYCRCDAPISADAFRSAVMMPGIVLGVLPLAISLLFGFGWLMLFGALMASTALGDVLILWALREVRPDAQVIYNREVGKYQIVEPASPHTGDYAVANPLRVITVTGQVLPQEAFFVNQLLEVRGDHQHEDQPFPPYGIEQGSAEVQDDYESVEWMAHNAPQTGLDDAVLIAEIGRRRPEMAHGIATVGAADRANQN